MKILVAAILVLGISSPLLAQTTTQVFTTPKGAFQFNYDSPLVRCARVPTSAEGGNEWIPFPSCQNGVCEDQALPSASTAACVAYPHDEFSKKVAFGAAAFFVAEVESGSTAPVCLQADPAWQTESSANSTLADEPSAQFRTVDHWMMHARDSVIYRVFHQGKCYEIGIQRVQVNTTAYDPGTFEEFTARDDARVEHRLGQVLRSFRFLN